MGISIENRLTYFEIKYKSICYSQLSLFSNRCLRMSLVTVIMISSLIQDSSDGFSIPLQMISAVKKKVLDLVLEIIWKNVYFFNIVEKEQKKSKLNMIENWKVRFDLYILCFIVCRNIFMSRLIVV
jgi:hypothetical protein